MLKNVAGQWEFVNFQKKDKGQKIEPSNIMRPCRFIE